MSRYSEQPDHPAWLKVAAQEGNIIKCWNHAMRAGRASAWMFVTFAIDRSLAHIPTKSPIYAARLEMFYLALGYANSCTRPSHRDY